MIICEVSIDWLNVLLVIGIFSVIAVTLTASILIVSIVCKVNTDEKVASILSNLAGANCGGCGCSGCEGFAKKLCSGDSTLSECHVTNDDNKQVIAKILGIDYEKGAPSVMVVKCNGGLNACNSFRYDGIVDCDNETLLFGGAKVCKTGCLGSGSCVNACPEKAIHLKNHCAHVTPENCISCGVCMTKCPKGLFERIPITAKVYIACSSHCKGKEVMNMCKNGCIGCGLCVKTCPEGAIKMENGLPVIDHTHCTGCEKCIEACPRNVINSRKNVFIKKRRRYTKKH